VCPGVLHGYCGTGTRRYLVRWQKNTNIRYTKEEHSPRLSRLSLHSTASWLCLDVFPGLLQNVQCVVGREKGSYWQRMGVNVHGQLTRPCGYGERHNGIWIGNACSLIII